MSTFGQLLAEAIPRAGFKSLRGFAEKSGNTVGTISRVIKGKLTPPEGAPTRWADVLGLVDPARTEFIRLGEAVRARAQGRAAPHIASLVEENNERGREITALKQRIADIEVALLTSKPATDEAIRKRYETSTREQLLDVIVRLNREVMFFSKGKSGGGPASAT